MSYNKQKLEEIQLAVSILKELEKLEDNITKKIITDEIKKILGLKNHTDESSESYGFCDYYSSSDEYEY